MDKEQAFAAMEREQKVNLMHSDGDLMTYYDRPSDPVIYSIMAVQSDPSKRGGAMARLDPNPFPGSYLGGFVPVGDLREIPIAPEFTILAGDIVLDASALLELGLPDDALAFVLAAVAEAFVPEGYEISGILIA